jgi:hypothetical protein
MNPALAEEAGGGDVFSCSQNFFGEKKLFGALIMSVAVHPGFSCDPRVSLREKARKVASHLPIHFLTYTVVV